MTASSSKTHPPPPPTPLGDDASPFLLRVYLTRRPHWRHPSEFDHAKRPTQDEYKLYVWRSTTLRTLAHLLHSAQSSSPSSSSYIFTHPLSRHAFRLVYFNSHRSIWCARDLGRDISRVSPSDLAQRMASDEAREMLGLETVGRGGDPEVQQQHQNGQGGQDASIRLGDCGILDGDVLECLITPPAYSHSARGAGAGSTATSARWGTAGVAGSSLSIRGTGAAGGGDTYPNHAYRRDTRREIGSGGGSGDMGSYKDRRPSRGSREDGDRGIRNDSNGQRW